jgi:excinuclease ABC subunit C
LKTLTLLEQAADIETIVTDTEKEALILENNLIKEHHPRYNIKLRDDKHYPCLRLSLEEEYPSLSLVRRVRKDRSLYFGPYPSATSLRETLKLIRRLFPIRTSLDTKFAPRFPLGEEVDPARYREVVQQVRMFLEGKDEALIADLKKKMAGEAERLNFEAAARIRDQIDHIQRVLEKQKAISRDFLDQDVFGFYRGEEEIAIYLLFLRRGKLLGGKGFALPASELPEGEVLESFISQYYRQGKFIPQQILLPVALPGRNLIEQWLGEEKKKKVRIVVPVRGAKRRLLNLARQNAQNFFIPQAGRKEGTEELLFPLQEKLHLSRVPRRIEAFDISNIRGLYAVGSMVLFQDGRPDKDGYRHFRIRTISGADDYGMMKEVLFRRYRKGLSEGDLPDLVLVDGGRGQLNVAREVFQELSIRDIDLISLAKERAEERPGSSGVEKTGEKIFHPHFPEPIILEKHSPLLNFLDRIRDEAHRFAISHHKKVRGKEAIKSILKEIPGIGAARQGKLVEFLGNVEKIETATVEEIIEVPGMTRRAAQAVFRFFHPEQQTSNPFRPQTPARDRGDRAHGS